MSSLVSIILPVFNREEFLPTAVQSVLQQTYSDWELLIIDDSSVDRSRIIAEQYAESDRRIKVYSNVYLKGCSGARNTGYTKSSGRYLAFLDSDDEWLPNHLQDSTERLVAYDSLIDLITSDAKRYYWKERKEHSEFKVDIRHNFDCIAEDVYVLRHKNLIFNYAKTLGLTGPVPTIVAKKSCFSANSWPESLQAAEDAYMLISLASKGARLAHMVKTNLNIYIHDQHTSNAGIVRDSAKQKNTQLEFVKAFEMIKANFNTTLVTRILINFRISQILFWQIAYNIYLQRLDYQAANLYFLKGMRSFCFNPFYWKTYILFVVKRILAKR